MRATVKIRKREADSVIKALEAGIVPQRGIQHLLVGRSQEVHEVIQILEAVSKGESDFRIWVGDFGSGKSFMLQTIQSLALQKNFVSSTLDLTPTRRFYATDGKAVALYTAIIDGISTRLIQNGNALNTMIDEWLNKVMSELAEKLQLPLSDFLEGKQNQAVENQILDLVMNFQAVGLGFEVGQVLTQYYHGIILNNRVLCLNAVRWLRGDIRTITESKAVLGINKIINDDNWYIALKTITELLLDIGYSGFVVNFDETVNLYKLPRSTTRERNYEQILNIYNETKSNQARGLFINFGATRKTVFDEYRGFSSYGALKGRLGLEDAMDSKLINTNRTTLPLKPLVPEEIYTLLTNLKLIFEVNYDLKLELPPQHIQSYMEDQLNRPGADEFLTPRAVIKEFIEIMDLIRQNPNLAVEEILNEKFRDYQSPVTKDEADDDDVIEVF